MSYLTQAVHQRSALATETYNLLLPTLQEHPSPLPSLRPQLQLRGSITMATRDLRASRTIILDSSGHWSRMVTTLQEDSTYNEPKPCVCSASLCSISAIQQFFSIHVSSPLNVITKLNGIPSHIFREILHQLIYYCMEILLLLPGHKLQHYTKVMLHVRYNNFKASVLQLVGSGDFLQEDH